MSAPTCSKCHTTMEPSNGIGTNGYHCANVDCTVNNGPQIVLNYATNARAVRALTVCWYEIMSVTCVRCSLKYNKLDPFDRDYHEKPGGCR